MSELKAATFDCYGTLVDWEAGLAAFLYDLARRCGEDEPPPGDELRRRWEEIQFELITGSFRSYRDVLNHSLRAWSGERGHRWNDHEGHALELAMQCWQPFRDTIPALKAARAAGLKLAVISNSDPAIMEHTMRQLPGLEFERVVLSADVHAYKPASAPFTRALDDLDLHPSEILHVAFGFKYDIATAKKLGFQTAWVNRHREARPDDVEPDHEWTDLWPLAELAGA